MRKIGSLPNEKQATALGDYLFIRKIENTLEPEEGGAWSLWIHDDSHLSDAKGIFDSFVQNPENLKLDQATHQAKVLRLQLKKEDKKSRNKTVDLRTHWYLDQAKTGTLTLVLIIISVGFSIASGLGSNRAFLQPFFITHYEVIGGYIQWQGGLPQVMHGQIWRLLTPIFIHFGIIHLIFNMLWLKDLGTMIERHQSTWLLGVQVLVIGVMSNLGQYWMSGPTFGGMSGVVYGLLGYIWLRGKFDPGSGLYLHRTIVIWMIAWFVICFTGLVGNVANTAHGVGLAVGLAWGYLSSGHLLRKFR